VKRFAAGLAWLVLLTAPVCAEGPGVLGALRGEVDRLYAKFSALPEHPVYYLSSEVFDTRYVRITAAWGGVIEHKRDTDRVLDLEMRIGLPALDNTHHAWGEGGPGLPVTVDDDAGALAADLWIEAERRYRDAAEKYVKVVADRAVKVKEEDPSPDFCPAPRVSFSEPPAVLTVDEDAREAEVRRVSAVFRRFPEVLESSCTFTAQIQTRYFVNSEGSAIAQTQPLHEIRLLASSRADDGMEFTLYRHWVARDGAALVGEAGVTAEAESIGRTLAGLKTAPLVDPFIGPALLSGRAAAVLFHEVLGHRLEGHRQKDDNADQTFTKKLGVRILPEFVSIVSDPTRAAVAGTTLMGSYRYDDEGVEARPVVLVDRGILKSWMMCRSPVRGFPASNGHGRKQAGTGAVARQANLLVQASRTMPVARLRAELIRLCKAAKKPYGLYFEDIEGGFTFTGRTVPNAFNVMPIVVRRIYTDGRPDELVRGVDLIGTPLTTLARIVAAGDDTGVFNGYCGAESGYVPVSATCPTLLIAEMEIQRKQKGEERQPLLPQPAWMRR
jgi:predicted Zn-dependent protease